MKDSFDRIYPRMNHGNCKVCHTETGLGKGGFCFDCYIESIIEEEGETGDVMVL